MKFIRTILPLSLLLTLSALSAYAENAPLDSEMKKVSYAIGNSMGMSLKSQKLEKDIDLASLHSGITDAVKGSKTLITETEMQQALQGLQASMMKKMQEASAENKKASDAFLAKNKTAPGVKTTASGLQYQIIKEGSGPNPKPEDSVEVNYRGTLIDGSEFDSSFKRNQTVTFPLNGVIKGWTEGIPLMKVGGKAKFFIPAELGYGPMDRPKIPGNSVLIFEVDLISIKG